MESYWVQLKVVDKKGKIKELDAIAIHEVYRKGDTFTAVENGKHTRYEIVEPVTLTVKEVPL